MTRPKQAAHRVKSPSASVRTRRTRNTVRSSRRQSSPRLVSLPVPAPTRGKKRSVRRTSPHRTPRLSRKRHSADLADACIVCAGDGEPVARCASCRCACHPACMRPPRRYVPLGVWVCPTCHVGARRHGIHLSRLGKLNAGCVDCERRGTAVVGKLKTCADCSFSFHEACLKRFHKVTKAGLADSNWVCRVCVAAHCAEEEAESRPTKRTKLDSSSKSSALGSKFRAAGSKVVSNVLDKVSPKLAMLAEATRIRTPSKNASKGQAHTPPQPDSLYVTSDRDNNSEETIDAQLKPSDVADWQVEQDLAVLPSSVLPVNSAAVASQDDDAQTEDAQLGPDYANLQVSKQHPQERTSSPLAELENLSAIPCPVPADDDTQTEDARLDASVLLDAAPLQKSVSVKEAVEKWNGMAVATSRENVDDPLLSKNKLEEVSPTSGGLPGHNGLTTSQSADERPHDEQSGSGSVKDQDNFHGQSTGQGPMITSHQIFTKSSKIEAETKKESHSDSDQAESDVKAGVTELSPTPEADQKEKESGTTVEISENPPSVNEKRNVEIVDLTIEESTDDLPIPDAKGEEASPPPPLLEEADRKVDNEADYLNPENSDEQIEKKESDNADVEMKDALPSNEFFERNASDGDDIIMLDVGPQKEESPALIVSGMIDDGGPDISVATAEDQKAEKDKVSVEQDKPARQSDRKALEDENNTIENPETTTGKDKVVVEEDGIEYDLQDVVMETKESGSDRQKSFTEPGKSGADYPMSLSDVNEPVLEPDKRAVETNNLSGKDLEPVKNRSEAALDDEKPKTESDESDAGQEYVLEVDSVANESTAAHNGSVLEQDELADEFKEPSPENNGLTEEFKEPSLENDGLTEEFKEPSLENDGLTEEFKEPSLEKDGLAEEFKEPSLEKDGLAEEFKEPSLEKDGLAEEFKEPSLEKDCLAEEFKEPSLEKDGLAEEFKEPSLEKDGLAEEFKEPSLEKDCLAEEFKEPSLEKDEPYADDGVSLQRTAIVAEQSKPHGEQAQGATEQDITLSEQDIVSTERVEVDVEREKGLSDGKVDVKEHDGVSVEQHPISTEEDKVSGGNVIGTSDEDVAIVPKEKSISEHDTHAANQDEVADRRDEISARKEGMSARIDDLLAAAKEEEGEGNSLNPSQEADGISPTQWQESDDKTGVPITGTKIDDTASMYRLPAEPINVQSIIELRKNNSDSANQEDLVASDVQESGDDDKVAKNDGELVEKDTVFGNEPAGVKGDSAVDANEPAGVTGDGVAMEAVELEPMEEETASTEEEAGNIWEGAGENAVKGVGVVAWANSGKSVAAWEQVEKHIAEGDNSEEKEAGEQAGLDEYVVENAPTDDGPGAGLNATDSSSVDVDGVQGVEEQKAAPLSDAMEGNNSVENQDIVADKAAAVDDGGGGADVSEEVKDMYAEAVNEGIVSNLVESGQATKGSGLEESFSGSPSRNAGSKEVFDVGGESTKANVRQGASVRVDERRQQQESQRGQTVEVTSENMEGVSKAEDVDGVQDEAQKIPDTSKKLEKDKSGEDGSSAHAQEKLSKNVDGVE